MFQLKEYQQRALDSLRVYFAESVRLNDADTAFYEITKRNFDTGIPYRSVKELPGLPYVCLRIPTGGGKTLVACHSLGIALKDLLHADRGVVLWLVPSNAIREQTLKALQGRHHPYVSHLKRRSAQLLCLILPTRCMFKDRRLIPKRRSSSRRCKRFVFKIPKGERCMKKPER